MSSTKSAPSLSIEPRPDPWLALWLGLVHSLAGAGAWLLQAPAPVRFAWLAVCTAGALLGFRRHLLRRGHGAVAAARWNRAGNWTVRSGAGRDLAAELTSHVSFNWLILMEFRFVSGRGARVALGPGSLSPDEFRRLRTRLRLEAFVA